MATTVSMHVVSLPWRAAWRGPVELLRTKRMLPRLDGVAFAVSGSTSGGSGTRDIRASVTLRRHVALVEWTSADACVVGRARLDAMWRDRRASVWSASLAPFRSNGTWKGQHPFLGDATPADDAVVAVLTYARVKPTKMFDFYVRSFAKTARHAVGTNSDMVAGVGFGVIPVRDACTMSFWRSANDVNRFAYGASGPHADVQRRAHSGSWLSESLFARFLVVAHDGVWGSGDPLA